MKEPKPFLPSKDDLKRYLRLLLIFPLIVIGASIIAVIGKISAQVLMATVPLPTLIFGLGIISLLIVFLWFYRKTRKQNLQKQKQEVVVTKSQEQEQARRLNRSSALESQEEEYEHSVWEIYRKEWETASSEKKIELNKRMNQWQELMKSGASASQAYYRVMQEESGKSP